MKACSAALPHTRHMFSQYHLHKKDRVNIDLKYIYIYIYVNICIYIYCPKKRTHFGFRTALMKMFDPLQMLIMLCVCIYI